MTLRKKKGPLRAAALFLTIVMLAGLFPAGALADSDAEEDAVSAAPPLVNVIETDEPAAVDPTPDETAEPEASDDPDAQTDPVEEVPDGAGADSAEPETDGDSAEAASFTVSYYLGAPGAATTISLSEETVKNGERPTKIPSTGSDGWFITAWTDANGVGLSIADLAITADTSYYACAIPPLVSEEHIVYIHGRETGKFEPSASLTRAEAAVILAQFLPASARGHVSRTFSDVPSGEWYSNAIMQLASFGILSGYSDGTFRPGSSITRAEFVSVIVHMTGVTGTSASFSDIANHWAQPSIEAAAAQGWISGYPDGTFRPGSSITRAEAVTVVNGVTGRAADMDKLRENGSVVVFPDVLPAAWYYGAVMEASVPHEYDKASGTERWTSCDLPTKQAAGTYDAGNAWYMIDDNGLYVYFKAGITKVNGKFYYSPTAGTTFTGKLNEEDGCCVFYNGTKRALANAFNLIGSTLFYWDLNTASAMELKAGLNPILGNTYWADEDGYVIRNNFGAGVATLGGKKYLSGGYCDIITSGLGYTSATSQPSYIDLKNQTFEFKYEYTVNNVKKTVENMYYLKEDYSLACDEWIGYLYFGTDCAYTSGDAALDSYVWAVVKNIVNNTAITKEQKLLRAYYWIRGGEGETAGESPFRYGQTGEGYLRGRYNEQKNYAWITKVATRMFKERSGMCYDWAAVYLFIARRLGFQAYIVVGSVFQTTTRHCWCMIQWDGKWHISDVEIEWGYLSRWYSREPTYRNLFAQTVPREYFSSYSNPECVLTYWVWEE